MTVKRQIAMVGDATLWKSRESVDKQFIQTRIDPFALFTLHNQTGEFQVKAMPHISEGLVQRSRWFVIH